MTRNLPVSEQKTVLLMILMAQYPHTLSLGGIDSLNITTFVSVTKSKL